jgi:uncharacterized protein
VPHNRLPATGAFVCHHLETGDPGPAIAFYLKLFGWTTREIRMAGSLGETTFRSGDADVATAGEGAGPGAFWLPCFAIGDLDGAVANAERLGGGLYQRTTDPAGQAVVLTDSTGARFGAIGIQSGCIHGTDAAAPGRFCWTELITDNPDGAAAFYQAFAGWTCVERHRGQEGRYWVFRHGGREVAGMAQPPEPRGQSCWVPYVLVVSAEDTAALAEELGGTIQTPPGDIPGRGRYAVLRDPGGALVGVFALTDAA